MTRLTRDGCLLIFSIDILIIYVSGIKGRTREMEAVVVVEFYDAVNFGENFIRTFWNLEGGTFWFYCYEI